MIRVSPKAKRLLSTLWVPDGEVLRLIRPPESYGHAGQLAFCYGRGEGGDQIVQHGGKQVLRIDPAVRRKAWDQILTTSADEVFSIGTVNGIRQPIVVGPKIRNVPK